MNFLFDIGHPAHVHQFRNVMSVLGQRGHQVFVTARKKNIIEKLLKAYKIDFIPRSAGSKNLFGKIIGLLYINIELLGVARRTNADVLIGGCGNVYVPHVAKLLSKKSIIFDDTEDGWLQATLYRPFVTAIYSPFTFGKDFGKKHYKYKGFHELAYLHPDTFRPNLGVKEHLGIRDNEDYIIIRFVSWNASHDLLHRGFSLKQKIKLVYTLSRHAKVLITSEETLPNALRKFKIDIDPSLMHDAMHYASLVFGESPTMCTEAAILGTPSIYISGRELGYVEHIAKNYGLISSFGASKNVYLKAIKLAEQIIQQKLSRAYWTKKRNRLLNDTINVVEFMADKIESI